MKTETENGAHADENTSGIRCARSYRTLRDGSFQGRFSQALRARLRSVLSLRDALAEISQQHLASRFSDVERDQILNARIGDK
jgi:hypothetical protein